MYVDPWMVLFGGILILAAIGVWYALTYLFAVPIAQVKGIIDSRSRERLNWELSAWIYREYHEYNINRFDASLITKFILNFWDDLYMVSDWRNLDSKAISSAILYGRSVYIPRDVVAVIDNIVSSSELTRKTTFAMLFSEGAADAENLAMLIRDNLGRHFQVNK